MNKINLNELTLENVGQWPPLIKYLAALLLAAIIIGFGYLFLIKPNLETHASLLNQEQTLRAEFEQKQRLAANLVAYKLQLQVMKERFGAMLKQLPAENEMPGLLEDISKTGIASGLTFDSFAPQTEVKHDFYIELPIKIAVVGNYHQLAVFVSRVIQMSRIVTLHDFEIKQQIDEKQKKPIGDLLIMQLTAKIYRYKTK
ncbi:type 4a pilus biogenesis protein PilO [Legionella gresilensis]|uniref:type 4a pilus biogenesis protein PilO n=1 Tax=Legionella gresilensis TaxID=91823 RepID=UPI0010418CA0|nr:type 4a pilus biogenesis protein PilO [Legionella gresilensis]